MKNLLFIIIVLAFAVLTSPTYASDLLHGRAVYETSCSSCHGEFGKGDGPRAETSNPKPINFTDPSVMENISPAQFERAVVQGLDNAVRHTFGYLLNPEEVEDVAYYIRSLIR